MYKNTNTGFTLLELLMALAIAAILVSLAAPSFANIIKDNRLTTQYNELLASLSLARSEAIKRAIPVTVCKSNDQITTPSCGGRWHDGWLVYIDIDGDGNLDSSDGDELIRTHSTLPANNTLIFPKNRITFQANALAAGFNGTFTLCDDRGDSDSKGLIVSITGRARKAISSDVIGSC